MGQLFPKGANTLARLSLVGGVLFAVLALVLAAVVDRSYFYTGVGQSIEQPVPFSHKHHAGALGIDCRYCHTSVEKGPVAGLPPTQTCMNCHSVMWADSPMLEPVRQSFKTGEPIEWNRVHDLPDFVYFDHSIHVNKGVSCVVCHGRVDQMPLTRQVHAFHMKWCLDCHRAPEKNLRPREHVFDMDWVSDGDPAELGKRLMQEYQVRKSTHCTACHR